MENTPGVVPLQKIAPNAIIIYGKIIPVEGKQLSNIMYAILQFYINSGPKKMYLIHLILAGSKLEAAIAEGPEALQKFIDSGQIEELHDVMPHNDEHDYLNDAYIDEDDNTERNVHNANHGPAQPWDNFRNRDSNMDTRNMDQDMRPGHHFGNSNNELFNMSGDVDHRNMRNQDVDFRNQRDFDVRNSTSDDYQMPYDRDQEFESYEEENEYGDDYYDNRNWQRNSKYNNRNFQENSNNQTGNYNRNFRQNAPFNRSNDNQYQPDNQNWNGPSDGGFRGRGNFRGGPRGGGRGFGGNKSNAWNNRNNQGPRGGGRGGPSRGRY